MATKKSNKQDETKEVETTTTKKAEDNNTNASADVKDAEVKAAEVVEEAEAGKNPIAEAVVEKKEVKLYKVKFVKNHEFNLGLNKVSAKKDETKFVELHIANKLTQRNIAVIIG